MKKTAVCPKHDVKSKDAVALNAKGQQVFRCVGPKVTHRWDIPHYFTPEPKLSVVR